MIFANALVAKCPHCNGTKELIQLLSGNTFGADNWSDTRQIAPMLPTASPVQRCPHCGHYYLIDKVETYKGDNSSSEEGWLTFPEAIDALRESRSWNLSNEERFGMLLITIWAFNDYARSGKDAANEEQVLVNEIIKEILPLVKDTLFKAELLREMGEFKLCIEALSSFSAENDIQKNIVKCIADLAEKKDRKVFKLSL